MIKFPIAYKTGNVNVTIDSDGTRICEWPDDEKPFYENALSIDLKITDQCDLGDVYNDDGDLVSRSKTCEFCHEMSSNKGKHADLDKVWDIWKHAQPGSEVAIGGGNPLDHPDLIQFLQRLQSANIIANMTVNFYHTRRYSEMIKMLQREKLIHGMGLSYRGIKSLNVLPDFDYANVVFHLILGVHDYNDCKAVIKWCKFHDIRPKILLLGYKTYGNGLAYYSEGIESKLKQWKKDIINLMGKDGLIISFDNKALDQLDMRKVLSKETWDKFYQGNEGTMSLYFSAVNEKFAMNSTSPILHDIYPGITPRDMLKTIHEEVEKNRNSDKI
jgi:hypothetical protein